MTQQASNTKVQEKVKVYLAYSGRDRGYDTHGNYDETKDKTLPIRNLLLSTDSDKGPYAEIVPHPPRKRNASSETAVNSNASNTETAPYSNPNAENHSDWKKEAEEKIKEAHVVIFLHSDYTNDEENIHNISWEIETAIKLSRNVIMCCLDGTNATEVPSWLKKVDNNVKVYTQKELFREIKNQATRQYDIFNRDILAIIADKDNPERELIVEQYRIYRRDAENVEKKRQSVNNFYFTLHGILFAAFPVALSKDGLNAITLFLVGFFYRIAGNIFNQAWIEALKYYKSVNTAKQRIINEIEERFPLRLNYAEYYSVMKNPLNKGRYKSFEDASFPEGFRKVYRGIGKLCFFMGIITFLSTFISALCNIDYTSGKKQVVFAILSSLFDSMKSPG